MDILVTAAGGFVGSTLIPLLVSEGQNVTGLFRSSVSPKVKKLADSGRCKLLQTDLSQALKLEGRFDAIIHNAGEIFGDKYPALDFVDANIAATKNIIDFALSCSTDKIVYFSSISVLGSLESDVVDEETPVNTPAAYGLSKLYGEAMLQEVAEKISSISLQLPGIVGPRSHGSWLASVVNKAARNQDIEIFNGSSAFNNVVHVDDVCKFGFEVIKNLAEKSDRVVLGAQDSMKLFEVVETIIKECGSMSKIIDCGERAGAFSINSTKAQEMYNYNPMPIVDILKSIAEI